MKIPVAPAYKDTLWIQQDPASGDIMCVCFASQGRINGLKARLPIWFGQKKGDGLNRFRIREPAHLLFGWIVSHYAFIIASQWNALSREIDIIESKTGNSAFDYHDSMLAASAEYGDIVKITHKIEGQLMYAARFAGHLTRLFPFLQDQCEKVLDLSPEHVRGSTSDRNEILSYIVLCVNLAQERDDQARVLERRCQIQLGVIRIYIFPFFGGGGNNSLLMRRN